MQYKNYFDVKKQLLAMTLYFSQVPDGLFLCKMYIQNVEICQQFRIHIINYAYPLPVQLLLHPIPLSAIFGLHFFPGTGMNRNEMLKNFAIGFLPIFIFIIADEIYGTTVGLIVAVISGLLYFIYYLFRFRTMEKFILFDTVLVAAMGGISLALNNALFFELKPAIVEMILVVLLGIHAFSSKPVLLMMSKRYMGETEFIPEQTRMIRQLSRLLFFVMLFHTMLIVYSAFFWSKEAWAFISGGLFYILFGLILAGQWIYLKFIRKSRAAAMPTADREIFDIVDEEGRVKGRAPRQAVHQHPDWIHPVVHLHLFNNQGKLYLQKRADGKDIYPGFWDTAVGGHMHSGETVEHALQREAKEELGLEIRNVKPLFRYIMRNEFESELVHSFMVVYNGPLKINRQEIETGRFWTIFEIKKALGKDIFTPNFEQEFAMLEKLKII